jgi:cellobiose phosphorylase
MPSGWEGFEVSRTFRGVHYEISVKREGSGNAVSLEVDGKAISGTIVPLPQQGVTLVKVKAVVR